jgi:fluoride exporter
MQLLAIMLAGALGTAARYGLTLALRSWMDGHGTQGWLGATLGATFPLGTLVINVGGTLLLAFLTTLALGGTLSPEWQTILGTGFCGGFTTFSTFELEAEGLLRRGEWMGVSVYVLGNLLLGFGAILLGRALALRLLGPGAAGVGP